MVDVKTVVVSVVAVLSVFLHLGIRAQPTIGSSTKDDFCSQLEEECEFQALENMRLRRLLESERQTMKTQENFSYSQAEENQRLKLELENKQQKIDTLENVSNSNPEEIRRLNLELAETRRLRTRELQSVTATFIGKFGRLNSEYGITKVEDKIYVLVHDPNKINVYADLFGFPFITDIALRGINFSTDIVYSNESKCVYISDYKESCIWVMTTTGEHRLTKWLNNLTWPHTLSLSNEGHLLVLRQSQPISKDSLDIYSLNATLIRRLLLPQEIKKPQHVVQTSTGNFIIIHQLINASSASYVISQLTNDGQLINRFIPRNKSEELNRPSDLSLDSDNNRLFVTDYDHNRLILFDSNFLTWGKIFKSKGINKIREVWRLFYDASKKHLFVAQFNDNISVFEIN